MGRLSFVCAFVLSLRPRQGRCQRCVRVRMSVPFLLLSQWGLENSLNTCMYRAAAASVQSVFSLLFLSEGIPNTIKDVFANGLQPSVFEQTSMSVAHHRETCRVDHSVTMWSKHSLLLVELLPYLLPGPLGTHEPLQNAVSGTIRQPMVSSRPPSPRYFHSLGFPSLIRSSSKKRIDICE